MESAISHQEECWDQNVILTAKVWNHPSMVTLDVVMETWLVTCQWGCWDQSMICQARAQTWSHLSTAMLRLTVRISKSKHNFVNCNLKSSVKCQYIGWDTNVTSSDKITVWFVRHKFEAICQFSIRMLRLILSSSVKCQYTDGDTNMTLSDIISNYLSVVI